MSVQTNLDQFWNIALNKDYGCYHSKEDGSRSSSSSSDSDCDADVCESCDEGHYNDDNQRRIFLSEDERMKVDLFNSCGEVIIVENNNDSDNDMERNTKVRQLSSRSNYSRSNRRDSCGSCIRCRSWKVYKFKWSCHSTNDNDSFLHASSVSHAAEAVNVDQEKNSGFVKGKDCEAGFSRHSSRDKEVVILRVRLSPMLSPNFYRPIERRLERVTSEAGNPVGADAWYGSALLSSILLFPMSPIASSSNAGTTTAQNWIHNHLDLCRRRSHRYHEKITALELGSGAVGLSSIALALLLAKNKQQHERHDQHDRHEMQEPRQLNQTNCSNSVHSKDRIILSDNDIEVLLHLRQNMERAFADMKKECRGNIPLPDIEIHRLEWKERWKGLRRQRQWQQQQPHHHIPLYIGEQCAQSKCSMSSMNDNHPQQQQQQQRQLHNYPRNTCVINMDDMDKEDEIDIVIGSELVYNNDTADACLEIVSSLLQKYSNILIVLVQVSHREGWYDRFIPRLQQRFNSNFNASATGTTNYNINTINQHRSSTTPIISTTIQVQNVIENASEHHRIASQWIRHGGTLNRYFDYGACYICNKSTSFT